MACLPNRRHLVPASLLVVLSTMAVGALTTPASGAPSPAPTTSHYEATADTATLNAQGRAAGHGGAQGLVILDFGRPAVAGGVAGTMDFGGAFVSLAAIGTATESFARGYFDAAPRYLRLDVVMGTNNSCGTGQPCGQIVCGCRYEPPSFASWGAQLAAEVEQVQAQTNSLRARSGFTDVVRIAGGDDAEPGFDPGFDNTYDLLAGYAGAVHGYQPAMIDYGSADSGYWTDAQLLQIADGFQPDVAVPEIYATTDATHWSSLASYAHSIGQHLTIFGVLTTAPAGVSPQAAYGSLVGALQTTTGQTSIRWFSTIEP